MGYIRVNGRVANPKDLSKSQDVESLADTGSIYTMIPDSELVNTKAKTWKLNYLHYATILLGKGLAQSGQAR
jgi:hypothetical protein